eukprot:352560-Chlamydomonas_euryale.AAC.1
MQCVQAMSGACACMSKGYFVPQGQAEDSLERFAIFLFTSNTPAQRAYHCIVMLSVDGKCNCGQENKLQFLTP